MKFFSEDSQYINAECESCGRILKIPRDKCNTLTPTELSIAPAVICQCGVVADRIINYEKKVYKSTPSVVPNVAQIQCPHCHMFQVSEVKTEPNGNLAIWLFLLGFVTMFITWIPWILMWIGGAFKGTLVGYRCTVCGYQWKIGDPPPKEPADPMAIKAIIAQRQQTVACRVCGQTVASGVRVCSYCGTARW
jgi:hypothetical protein